MERRRALKLIGGGLAAVSAGKATDNVVLGYGVVTGTNLLEQDLDAFVRGRLLEGRRTTTVGESRVDFRDETVSLYAPDEGQTSHEYPTLTRSDARDLDERYGLDGLLVDGLPTLQSLHADRYAVEPMDYRSFFELVEDAAPAPAAVELLRRRQGVDPGLVEQFAGADPADPESVVTGLVDGFREHTSYDVARYAAGSIQYHVIFGAADVKQHFEEDVDFRSLLENETTGLFCNEYAARSIEALHAVPAREQSVPVLAGRATDTRHKHVYTAIASVVRDDGDLVVPLTFVDYTHTTLYDDFHVDGLLGEGLDAYNSRHRMTRLRWQ